MQFGHKGPGSHPGGIGLDNAVNVMEFVRADPCPGTDRPGDGVGGGHKGIGPMVDIEMCALSPFKEDLPAPPYGLIDLQGYVCNIGP